MTKNCTVHDKLSPFTHKVGYIQSMRGMYHYPVTKRRALVLIFCFILLGGRGGIPIDC